MPRSNEVRLTRKQRRKTPIRKNIQYHLQSIILIYCLCLKLFFDYADKSPSISSAILAFGYSSS